MTLAEIMKEFDVVRGLIRTPGKFQGEAPWVVAAYQLVLDGDGCKLAHDDDDMPQPDLVMLDDAFKREFGIGDEYMGIVVYYCDMGFVYGDLVTHTDLIRLKLANIGVMPDPE